MVGQLVLTPLSDKPLQEPRGTDFLPVVRVISSEIMREIQDPRNADAVFVLPSQLNGAEYPSDTSVVSSVGAYKWDPTGGPRGQLAVHPAMGQFILDNAANTFRPGGVAATHDLFEAVSRKDGIQFRLDNGYLRVPALKGGTAQQRAGDAFAEQLHRMRTIAAKGVPATGLEPGLRTWSNAWHHVNMVYASAVPIGAYNNPATGDSSQRALQQRIGALVLLGQYYGALRLAIDVATSMDDRRARIFLMPLGGGVFRNPRSMIAKSLSKALELAARDCPQLVDVLDVCMLTWEGNPGEGQEFKQLLQKQRKIRH